MPTPRRSRSMIALLTSRTHRKFSEGGKVKTLRIAVAVLALVAAAFGQAPVTGGTTVQSTGSWTSGTARNTAITQTITGYNTMIITLAQTTTITGGVVTFECSDTVAFTNAYPQLATQLGVTGVAPSTTYTLQASTNADFAINVGAWAACRVRLSTVITGSGTVSVGVQAAALPSTMTAFLTGGTISVNALPAGANIIGKVDLLGNAGAIMDFAGQNAASPANSLLIGGQFNTSPTTLTSGNASPLQLNSAGQLLVACTGCSAGSTVSLIPATSGGLTLAHTVLAASTNATSLKASAGQVYSFCLNNNTTYPIFLKLYNKASAPTVGTDTPVNVLEAQAGVPICKFTEQGFAFATGIAWATTKLATDADTTAVALNDGTVEFGYK
jgi:hypothetical protein